MKTLAKIHSHFSPTDDDEPVHRPRPVGDEDGIRTGSLNVLLSALIILMLCFSLVLMLTFSMVATAYGSNESRGDVNDGSRQSLVVIHRQAVLAYDERRYTDALRGLLEVQANDPDNLSVQYLIGNCFLYGLGQPELAIPYLQQASKRVCTLYDRWDLEQRNAPTTAIFDLGKALELNGQYAEAKGTYTQFLGHLRPSKGIEGRRMYTAVVRGIEGCDRAMDQQSGLASTGELLED